MQTLASDEFEGRAPGTVGEGLYRVLQQKPGFGRAFMLVRSGDKG